MLSIEWLTFIGACGGLGYSLNKKHHKIWPAIIFAIGLMIIYTIIENIDWLLGNGAFDTEMFIRSLVMCSSFVVVVLLFRLFKLITQSNSA